MTLPQLAARLRRLQSLAMGLRRESQSVGTGYAPLTPQEWYDYASALCAAAKALDAARVPLSSALRRLDGSAHP